MPRSVFFAFKKFLCQLCDKNIINFDYHLNKTTKPKNIKYKYSPWQRLMICNYCFSNIEAGNFYDYTSIWLEIRKSHKLSIYGNFDTISLKTFKKIISLDLRYTKKAVKPYQPKHPIRTKVKEIGYMQMDLKILGLKETSCGKNISTFNMIDTSSRVAYSETIDGQNASQVIAAMDNAFVFYKSCGIKIKTIQTDNAMMFKNTNFVTWNEYATWCNRFNIIRRTIPLGEPQCNGCVERFHLTIDKEQHMKLMRCKTQDEVEVVMKEYMDYYNNNRWHYYV